MCGNLITPIGRVLRWRIEECSPAKPEGRREIKYLPRTNKKNCTDVQKQWKKTYMEILPQVVR